MKLRGRPGPLERARSVVVPFPGLDTDERAAVARVIPSGRSLLVAFAALAAGLAALLLARETSLFAVERIEVRGAPPGVTRQVEQALADVRGDSLLKLDAVRLRTALETLPTVRAASLDRAFPRRLVVDVVPEQAVAVVRQGASAWLVSDRGRVMATVARRARPALPRVWVPRTVALEPGGLATGELRTAVAAVAPLRELRFPGRVAAVASTGRELTMRLRGGLLVQLGEPGDVRLKLAVTARVLPLLEPETAYLDVSVPERPVAGTTLDSKVEGEVSGSTGA
jgi:cell division septal protein FtsQ